MGTVHQRPLLMVQEKSPGLWMQPWLGQCWDSAQLLPGLAPPHLADFPGYVHLERVRDNLSARP